MFHVAQVNIARLLAPLDDPRIHGFASRLEEINRLAESSPGFVWRFTGAEYGANDSRILFNMSVWETLEALKEFTYRSTHRELLKERHSWFERMDTPSLA